MSGRKVSLSPDILSVGRLYSGKNFATEKMSGYKVDILLEHYSCGNVFCPKEILSQTEYFGRHFAWYFVLASLRVFCQMKSVRQKGRRGINLVGIFLCKKIFILDADLPQLKCSGRN